MGGGGGGGGGFFSNPVQNIGAGLGAIAGGVPGALIGGSLGSVASNKGQQTPPPPGMDPALAELRDKRIKESQDFRASIPGQTQDMNKDLETASTRGLASDLATNKASYNRRGLMGSGLNQAADAGSVGKASASLAQGKQQMYNQLQDQADQMEQSAISNGYQYWQSSKAVQDSAYNAALSNMMAARSGTSALVGAAFKGGGAALGAA